MMNRLRLFLASLTPQNINIALAVTFIAIAIISPKMAAILIYIIMGLALLKIIYSTIKRIFVIFPLVRKKIITRGWRMVVHTRKFYAISPTTELFFLLSLLIIPVIFVVLLIWQNLSGANVLIAILAITLSCAAFFDIKGKVSWLIKKAWARVIGKLLFAGIGSVAFFIALAGIKQSLYQMTQVDAKHFPEFVNLAATLYTPIIYCYFIGFLLMTMVVIEWFAIMLPMSISPLLSSFYPGKLARVSYRLRTGKKEPSDHTPFQPRDLLFLLRIFAPLALVITFSYIANGLSATTDGWLNKTIISALIEMHYHDNADCQNLPWNTKLLRLDKDTVSVVQSTETGGFTFSKQRCPLTSVMDNPQHNP
ncbi:hypothetical protein [Serratia sp. AKBS12]|uniref:hypothetical protein n=1 Tax=Serratia sp. AKBS12 TaxID=2974597 RepID=UPI0021662889|nr:hypothetical protein [Serratia sp. AKBS12]MCS3405862.1 hypothetical protein [Serratia sp. AKBS12]